MAAWRLGHLTKQDLQSATRQYGTLPTAAKVSLAAGDALVDQDFNLNPTVLGPSGFSLIRCRCSVFAHGARRHDMPHRHLSFLHEISDDGFSSVLAQIRVHRSATGRVGISCHLDDVSLEASRGVSQFPQLN